MCVAAQLGLTMQAMYPERMYRCFIINAPSFFAMLWRVMDPLMTERVKKKISIFRTVRPPPCPHSPSWLATARRTFVSNFLRSQHSNPQCWASLRPRRTPHAFPYTVAD